MSTVQGESNTVNIRNEGHPENISGPSKELDPLAVHLNNFYDDRVRISLDRKEICEDIAYNVVQKIIRKIQTVDSRFRASGVIPSGIPYDGLQAEEPIHIDMILQLSLGARSAVYVAADEISQGVRLQPPPEHSQWHDCMSRSRFISASKLNLSLRKLVKKSVSVIQKHINEKRTDKIPEKLSSLMLEEGPAIRVTINRDISVGILPAFVIPVVSSDSACPSSSHAVIRESKGQDGSREMAWKVSFFVAEKNKIRALGSEGCRIQLLRILTEIRDTQETLRKLSSYHLKNILFHESDDIHDPSDWAAEKITERFLGLLGRLEKCLADGNCPLYYRQPPDFKPQNMFSSISHEDMASMKNTVREIKENPELFVSVTSEADKRHSAWPWELELMLPPDRAETTDTT